MLLISVCSGHLSSRMSRTIEVDFGAIHCSQTVSRVRESERANQLGIF